MNELDRLALRGAFGAYMTGVTVATAVSNNGSPVGFTANSFSSVSLHPPLLLVCPSTSLSSFQVFESCENFAINILATDQQEISNQFAQSGDDRFKDVQWRADASGCPILDGVAASFSCRRHSGIPAGDHLILIGEVLQFDNCGKAGLGYANGSYFSLELERQAANLAETDSTISVGAIIEHQDTVLMQKVASGWRPLTMTASARSGSLAALRQFLIEAGLDVAFGPVYSIFEGRSERQYSTYYRATAESSEPCGIGEFVKIDKLSLLSYTSPAVADMMNRYVAERKSGVFNLYVGDDVQGEIHLFGEDS